jgi:LysR family glycine cleavage system transcriptional activator
MTDRLPALHSLRTFESASRLGNFTRAAAELHLTHGAISHQMKGLERELGVVLFHRRGRGVQLTEPGRAFAATVRDALDRIVRGVEEACCPPSPRIG